MFLCMIISAKSYTSTQHTSQARDLSAEKRNKKEKKGKKSGAEKEGIK